MQCLNEIVHHDTLLQLTVYKYRGEISRDNTRERFNNKNFNDKKKDKYYDAQWHTYGACSSIRRN